MQTEKSAPARIHYFIVEQLNVLAVRGKVLSVLVQDSSYLVILSLGDVIAYRQLSPYDVSRGLRGDPNALTLLRADLLRDVTPDAVGLTPPATQLAPFLVISPPTFARRH